MINLIANDILTWSRSQNLDPQFPTTQEWAKNASSQLGDVCQIQGEYAKPFLVARAGMKILEDIFQRRHLSSLNTEIINSAALFSTLINSDNNLSTKSDNATDDRRAEPRTRKSEYRLAMQEILYQADSSLSTIGKRWFNQVFPGYQ